jgi:hypothetical protein
MFHSAKTLAIAAALVAIPASAAFAQGAYGVSVSVQTLGMPGGFSVNSGGLPLDSFEYRETDPLGGYWGNQANNTVFADGAARGWAQPGELRVATDATASAESATNFPNSYPYGFGEVRFWDTVTVTSDTLPVGTPVTMVLSSELKAKIEGEGLFAGTYYGEHSFGGRSSALQKTFSQNDVDASWILNPSVVNTKVGARFAISGRLYLHTRAHYYQTSPRAYSGLAEGEVVLKAVLQSVSADSYLVADSGATYHVPVN